MKDTNLKNQLKIHAENYMGDVSGPLAQLRQLEENFPTSVHVFGLQIGSEGPLNKAILNGKSIFVTGSIPSAFRNILPSQTMTATFSMTCYPCPKQKTA